MFRLAISVLVVLSTTIPDLFSATDGRRLARQDKTLVNRRDFSRYEVIISRKPFGEPPVVNVNTGAVAVAANADSFIKNLRLVAITENDDGTYVGFVDIVAKKNYFVKVGETTDDEITVLLADYQGETVALRKGTEDRILRMGEPVGAGVPGVPVPGLSPAAAASTARVESYLERLRKRREAMKTSATAEPKLTGEELKKHLEEYQLELIRAKGEKGPPLPMMLTPEMDAKLVSEGVLPPREGGAAAK